MKKKELIVTIISILVVAVVVIWAGAKSGTGGKYDAFASCIAESGTEFYGAFWCPHCQAQKKAFGSSQKLLPYIECSTPDGQGQLEICTEKGIEGYPTWIFPDGERLSGEVELDILSNLF